MERVLLTRWTADDEAEKKEEKRIMKKGAEKKPQEVPFGGQLRKVLER